MYGRNKKDLELESMAATGQESAPFIYPSEYWENWETGIIKKTDTEKGEQLAKYLTIGVILFLFVLAIFTATLDLTIRGTTFKPVVIQPQMKRPVAEKPVKPRVEPVRPKLQPKTVDSKPREVKPKTIERQSSTVRTNADREKQRSQRATQTTAKVAPVIPVNVDQSITQQPDQAVTFADVSGDVIKTQVDIFVAYGDKDIPGVVIISPEDFPTIPSISGYSELSDLDSNVLMMMNTCLRICAADLFLSGFQLPGADDVRSWLKINEDGKDIQVKQGQRWITLDIDRERIPDISTIGYIDFANGSNLSESERNEILERICIELTKRLDHTDCMEELERQLGGV